MAINMLIGSDELLKNQLKSIINLHFVIKLDADYDTQ